MVVTKEEDAKPLIDWLSLSFGWLIGLAAFFLESLRVEPTFGLSIPIWSVGPLFALLRFGPLACLVSAVTAAALIVTFTTTYFALYDAVLTLISITCAVLVVWRTRANRFVDGVLISFIVIVPLLIWRHKLLFSLDFNAGFLVLSTSLLSLLGPGLFVQWLALRPTLLARMGPSSIALPRRGPLHMAALVRLLLVPLMVLSVLVTTHFFTTEWVFSRAAQLERGSRVLAEMLVDLARVELPKSLSSTAIASNTVLSPVAAPLGKDGVIQTDTSAVPSLALRRAEQDLNERVIQDFKRRHPDLHFDMSYALLVSNTSQTSTGFTVPSTRKLQTNIDFFYKRQYEQITAFDEQGLLLKTTITAAPSVETGLRFSMWGLLASVLLLLGTEWLYRRWLVHVGREAGHTFRALSAWGPGQRPLPKLPGSKNLLREFDQASAALDSLVTEIESQYTSLSAISDERQRLLNQQLATLSALQEPVIVLDAKLEVDKGRSYQLNENLLSAIEPVLIAARSALVKQEGTEAGVEAAIKSLASSELLEWVTTETHERLAQALVRARTCNEPQFDVEFHIDTAEGRLDYWVSVGIIGSGANTSAERELVLLFTDISLLLDAQQRAAKSARMASLGEVATGAAHQLNQPLNIIRMSVLNLGRYLAPSSQDGQQALAKLERINAQVDRAAEIIEGMKAFAQQPDAHRTRLAVSAEVGSALAQMQRQFTASNTVLERKGNAEEAVICANSASIKAIVHSLVGNALDAFIEFRVVDPHVTVHESVSSNHYILEIADNGGGIDEVHLQHIFDPFFTTKHSLQRPGLGLALVWRLVQEIGGTIECENTAVGALFRVALPLSIAR